eukprot:13014927-Alexandrium_andersonii.AAC.1
MAGAQEFPDPGPPQFRQGSGGVPLPVPALVGPAAGAAAAPEEAIHRPLDRGRSGVGRAGTVLVR